MQIDRSNYAYAYPFALLGCWIAAWLLHMRLASLWSSAAADTAYWVSAKIIIWVVPVFVLIGRVERARWRMFLELTNPLKGLLVGLGISLLLLGVFYLFDRFFDQKKHLAIPLLGLAFLNGVIVAPLVEEIVFRGFYLQKLLLNGLGFWVANGITTIFFVVMHLPGWSFQGKLHVSSMLAPIGSLAFFSLVLGLVKVKTHSLYATILIHVLNNLYSLSR